MGEATQALRLQPQAAQTLLTRAQAYRLRAMAREKLGDLVGMREDYARADELEGSEKPLRSAHRGLPWAKAMLAMGLLACGVAGFKLTGFLRESARHRGD